MREQERELGVGMGPGAQAGERLNEGEPPGLARNLLNTFFAINFHFLQLSVFHLKKFLLQTRYFKDERFIKLWRITNYAKKYILNDWF